MRGLRGRDRLEAIVAKVPIADLLFCDCSGYKGCLEVSNDAELLRSLMSGLG